MESCTTLGGTADTDGSSNTHDPTPTCVEDNTVVFDEEATPAMYTSATEADTKNVLDEQCTSSDSDNIVDENGKEDSDIEEILSPREIEHRLMESKRAKEQGNDLYKRNDFSEALEKYSEAIRHCPPGHEEAAPFYANRAACHLKMENYEACANDCTEALGLQRIYPKVTLRRAAAYEKLERYEDALEDYREVLVHDAGNPTAREAVTRLPPVIDAQREKLKNEMIGNLKKLGNMCLKPFGLSTDNFNMVQDPKTGGYSMNFTQGS
eukprot:m.372364 g.372364  ORF g.372364 m.372364 type:complete len:266 (+) comp20872_c0_seq1:141-938(+)